LPAGVALLAEIRARCTGAYAHSLSVDLFVASESEREAARRRALPERLYGNVETPIRIILWAPPADRARQAQVVLFLYPNVTPRDFRPATFEIESIRFRKLEP
jgi:hypothetical protein